jgi:cyclophilin family peptidyl-prolyl cis-trans isomerase
MNASLAPLSDISVLQYQGDQVVLDGSGSGAPKQTFAVASSNPDIAASVAQGQFLTMSVSHASSGTGDPAFSGNIVIQLFNDLTPTSASKIEGFVTSGFYNNKNIFRVASGFPDSNGYIVQGGSPSNLATGVSGLPGTPFANEIVQQLAFTNPGQLALANTGLPNSNDTQYFITTGAPTFLDYNFTILGQVVSGLDLVQDMTRVALTIDPIIGEPSKPVSPIVVSSETLANTNPDGVLHIDATQAQAGETSTITVTANDPATNTSQVQSFKVTVVQNPNAPTLPLKLRPLAYSALQNYAVNTPQAIQLAGDPANSSTSSGQTLAYAITAQPTHGTMSNFNASNGSLTYTPDPDFQGDDSFQFTVTNSGAGLTSKPATVTLTTTPVPGPTAAPVAQDAPVGGPTTIQLSGSSPLSNQALSYSIVTQPTQGTISQFDATNGTLIYTPNAGAQGTEQAGDLPLGWGTGAA